MSGLSHRGRVAAASAALAALLLTSGCIEDGGISLDLGWKPPTWPEAVTQQIDALPDPVDRSGLTLIDHRFRNGDTRVQGRVSYLPSAETAAFNTRIDEAVQAGLDQAATHSGMPYTPQVSSDLSERGCVYGSTTAPAAQLLSDPSQGPGGDGVAIACDIVVAAGTIFGERVRTVVGGADGSVIADAASVVYTDTASGETATANELWSEGAVDRLYTEVINQMRRENGALSAADAHPNSSEQRSVFERALASTVPGGDGTLAFTIPIGFTSVELDGLGVYATTEPYHVSVPADLVTELATPFGKTVADAAGQPFAGPALGVPSSDWVNCKIVPCVAVTYDDGPHGYLTPRLLDNALSMRVPLTFYLIGPMVEANPQIAKREVDEGHDVGNHSWNHPNLPLLSDDDVAWEINTTNDAIERATGVRPTTFRPPYGDINQRVLDIAKMPAINWSVDTNDWQKPGWDALISRGVDEVGPGGIILYHDIHDMSVDVAPQVWQGLRDRGFTLVTVPTLYGGTVPPDAVWASATRRWGE